MPRCAASARAATARSIRSPEILYAFSSAGNNNGSAFAGLGANTPFERIVECRPDHLVKGGDWTPDRIVGAQEVQGWGGKVHSIPFRYERSTTELLSRIRT